MIKARVSKIILLLRLTQRSRDRGHDSRPIVDEIGREQCKIFLSFSTVLYLFDRHANWLGNVPSFYTKYLC